VDETVLATDTTANFTSGFGADGAGTVVAYALGVVAAASGLVDTATGQAVNLSMTTGDVVEGRTATSNDLVFEDDEPAVTFGNLVGTGTTLPQFGLAR